MFGKGDRSSSSRSGQLVSSGFDCVRPPTSEGHNSFVRTPFRVFFVTPRPDEGHSICNCSGTYVHQVQL